LEVVQRGRRVQVPAPRHLLEELVHATEPADLAVVRERAHVLPVEIDEGLIGLEREGERMGLAIVDPVGQLDRADRVGDRELERVVRPRPDDPYGGAAGGRPHVEVAEHHRPLKLVWYRWICRGHRRHAELEDHRRAFRARARRVRQIDVLRVVARHLRGHADLGHRGPRWTTVAAGEDAVPTLPRLGKLARSEAPAEIPGGDDAGDFRRRADDDRVYGDAGATLRINDEQ